MSSLPSTAFNVQFRDLWRRLSRDNAMDLRRLFDKIAWKLYHHRYQQIEVQNRFIASL